MLTLLLATIVGGLSYWAGLSWQRWNVASIRAFLQSSLGATPPPQKSPADDRAASRTLEADHDPPGVLRADPEPDARASDQPLTPPTLPASGPDRASILIFSPRPGSLAAGRPTRLCYAVSDAVQARVEPGVGDVPPTSTLNCVRIAPARTTTYQLTASGRDGHQVTQQLVIFVR